MTRDTELAWAAGFLDGEGTFAYSTYTKVRAGKKYYRWQITCAQVRKEPLDRLVAALDGKVYGPYISNQKNRQPYYVWSLCYGKEKVFAAIEQLRPFLSVPKLEQIEEGIMKSQE